MNYKRLIFFLFFLFPFQDIVIGQQNHSLFFQHYLPESNLLNPAVPISCKWYIGLPVISSIHFNYGNSSFTHKQLFNKTGNGGYIADVDGTIDRLHFRNYLGTELHLQLFALGHRRGDYSFMFTLTEKNNIPFVYPKEPIELAWYGNSMFEGKEASFKGTGLYFNHYREYALSLSKQNSSGTYIGARAKLLFGKLNLTTRSTDINIFTDKTSFHLNFDGDLLVHSSLPVNVDTSDGFVDGVTYDENTSIAQLILNRNNPGFAVDFGIVYPFSEDIELSASIIDLGFIRWRSNLNTLNGEGTFSFVGPLGDSVEINYDSYLDSLQQSFLDSMNIDVSEQKYTTMLPTRIIAGGTYLLNDKLSLGLQGGAIIFRNKIMPSMTFSCLYNPINNINLIASYTLQYYSLKSVGLGLSIGKGPVQAYIMSDNLPGSIWLMSSRNINLRFGMNINLGCNLKEKKSSNIGGAEKKVNLKGDCYKEEKQLLKTIRKRRKR